MRILIVNFFYSPSSEAHSHRWTQLAEYWAKRGESVEVLTGGYVGKPRFQLQNKVKVTRVGIPKWRSFNYDQESIVKYSSNKLLSSLRYLYTKLRWPDSFWYWCPFAILEISKRFRCKYDLVISYYPSFSAHLAVLFLKIFSKNNSFKWVLDYGDPFSTSELIQPNNIFFYNRINIFFEKLFAKKGQMIFNNSQLIKAYINKLSLPIKNHPKKIPSLVNIDKFYIHKKNLYKKSFNKITLNYIGKFYQKTREPFILFELFKRLNEISDIYIELNIYGPTGGFDLNPKNNQFVKYKGLLERSEAIKCMKKSNFLINIENINCLETPSKTAEIIATGIPIVNISNPQSPDSLLIEYEKLGGCFSILRDDLNQTSLKNLVEFLKNKINSSENKNNDIQKDNIKNLLSDNLIENISKQYLDLV